MRICSRNEKNGILCECAVDAAFLRYYNMARFIFRKAWLQVIAAAAAAMRWLTSTKAFRLRKMRQSLLIQIVSIFTIWVIGAA